MAGPRLTRPISAPGGTSVGISVAPVTWSESSRSTAQRHTSGLYRGYISTIAGIADTAAGEILVPGGGVARRSRGRSTGASPAIRHANGRLLPSLSGPDSSRPAAPMSSAKRFEGADRGRARYRQGGATGAVMETRGGPIRALGGPRPVEEGPTGGARMCATLGSAGRRDRSRQPASWPGARRSRRTGRRSGREMPGAGRGTRSRPRRGRRSRCDGRRSAAGARWPPCACRPTASPSGSPTRQALPRKP